ncbi:MAG: hypothetical protein KDA28_09865, partial [Phycisphaerales bacterium]|nr:hypothetical protein [Phycisphaerales bacterium]
SDEQRTAIGDLRASHDQKASRLNKAWVDAIDESERDGGGEGGFFAGGGAMAVMLNGEEPESPTKDARESRTELDTESLARLEALLRPEQRERLPEKVAEPEDGMRFQSIRIGG